MSAWAKELNLAITVCDTKGIILEMNDRAMATFRKSGGEKPLGTNLFDCHPEPARTKLGQLMETHQTNAYTIEKNGVKKLIYQTPWFEKEEFRGLVELSMEIPADMPHFVRKP